ALELAKNGWNLYLHYHQNEKEIKKLLAKVVKYKVEAILIQADLSKDADVQKVIDHIFHIDAIVYSSGIAPYHLFVDVDDETIETMLQLHIKSPMKLVRTLLPKLMRNQTSHIILISSIWGQTGAACEVLYSTVKGAQIALV